MRRTPALLLSTGLSFAAAMMAAVSALLLRDRLGGWQWLFYLSALLACGGALCLFSRKPWSPLAWLLPKRERKGDLPADQPETDLLPGDLAALLDERLHQLERRERELANRLAAHRQLFEFPPPIDLAHDQPPIASQLERDRRLDRLLEEKTGALFERIQKNEYVRDGTFQAALVREDLYSLANDIARLYARDARRPLSGVSAERALRAASHCCFKFLVELEKLPLDIRSYDIATIYGHVRQAVKVYGLYRSASPYMSWLRGAYYGTRIALGANPLTLGAWWFASSLGSRGASALATRVANRWALQFLHDIVRIVGYELASVYDENLRFRNPNWCFAAELTQLVQSFPSSEAALRRALSLIGSLQFQNEYDRVFFFRCIVEGKRAGLNRVPASDLLPEQRKEIAERLEAFLKSNIADPAQKATERWREGVERRLDIRLTLDGPVFSRPEEEQRRDAIRSLAGYLLEIKQSEPESLRSHLEPTNLVEGLPETALEGVWQELQDNPPFFFEMPELVPGEKVAGQFLDDLARLAVHVSPRYPMADEIVISAAVRLRAAATRIKALLDRRYAEEVAGLLPEDAPTRRVPPTVARAVLDLVQDGEPLHFIYGDVLPAISGEAGQSKPDRPEAWLVGAGNRLVAFTMANAPELLWEGGREVRVECVQGYWRARCRLTGGHWLTDDAASTPMLLLRGSMLSRSKRCFAPLVDFCRPDTKATNPSPNV